LPEFYRGLFALPRGEMPDPEHARAEVCLRGAMIEEQASVAPQIGRVECVSHDQKDVHVLGFQLVGDERSKYHEPSQVIGPLRDTVDTLETEGQRPSPSWAHAEPVENLAQRRRMHTER
jgi:hypothetical protein